MEALIGLLVFGAVSMGAWSFMRPREDPIARRIRASAPPAPVSHDRLQGGFGYRVLWPVLRRAGESFSRMLPHNLVRSLDRMLEMANSRLSTPEFVGLWAASAVVGLLLAFYLGRSGSSLGSSGALLYLAVLAFWAMLPYVVLRRRVARRQRAIQRALPDALDLLVTAVEAGLGVDAAVAMVTERTGGPLAEAFALYLKEVGLGRTRREALQDVAYRTGVQDLIRFAASVAQAEQMGTNLGDVLRRQAEDLRLLRRQRAQEAAQRAPVLMTIPLALCFLPAMGAVIVVPSVLNLINFVSGMGGR